MMASASSGNPYKNYDNTEIEQDIIDPDDGMCHDLKCFVLLKIVSSERQ